MNFKNIITCLFIIGTIASINAQDELFKELDTVKSTKKEIETAAFKGLQIANMQSTKMPTKGEWYVLIAHRFGDLTQGFDNFFGLDNAFTKIGTVYGATEWLSLGLTRHTYEKTYELAAKYKLANQEIDGFPVTIVGYNTVNINSELKKALYPDLQFNDRMSYNTQLLISRKFSNKFSLELAPIYIHKNLFDDLYEQKNLLLLGAGTRYKLTKRLSLNLEYAARVNLPKNSNSIYSNPLTVGLDIETGGHVFQLVFSNSQQMNDVATFSKANGSWDGGGSLYFGFNMLRVFN